MDFLFIGAILSICSESLDIFSSYKRDRWAYILFDSKNTPKILLYYEVVEIYCHTFDHIIWLSSGSSFFLYYSFLPIISWIIYLILIFSKESYFQHINYILIISLFVLIEVIFYRFNSKKNNDGNHYLNYLGIIPNLILFVYDVLFFYFERNNSEIDIKKSISKFLKSLIWLIQGIHLKSILLIINNIFGIVSSIFGIIRKIYLIKIKKDLILSQKEERKKIKKEKCMKLICSPGEEEFKFKGYQIIFKAPKEINNCNWVLLVNIKSEYELKNKIKEIKKISYIPKPQENEISDYFIKQTNIGNCFLVSSIISIINIPGILDYLFYFEDENKDNYTDSDSNQLFLQLEK